MVDGFIFFKKEVEYEKIKNCLWDLSIIVIRGLCIMYDKCIKQKHGDYS